MHDGQHLGRSWLLLGGLLPFDYDDITIERVEQGRWFQEDSTMLSQRSWRHHRAVEPVGDAACTVTDTITFVRRFPVPVRLLEFTFGQTFAHRHRRLRRRYGHGLMRITDARGLKCPMPLVMAKTAMETVPAGEELVVLATDPEAAIDLAAWAADRATS